MAIHQNLSMTIKATPVDLVRFLEENKAKHLADYKIALEVYWEDAEAEVKKLLKTIRDKSTKKSISYSKVEPINNEKLYDKYIGMLKLAKDETIELTTEDYGCIVDDNWSWAVTASTLNSSYSSKRI